MFVAVSYDIRDDGRRNRVCNELKNYGKHVQYSVFECDLSLAKIQELQGRLGQLINQRQDSVRYYFLCKACLERMDIQGRRSPLRG